MTYRFIFSVPQRKRMKILSSFEAEELLAEIAEWWHHIELKLSEGQVVEKPRFVKMTEIFLRRVPSTTPCKKQVQ